MHEASIMQNVFDLAFARLPSGSATRVVRLRLRVGVLAGVVPEALTFAFEAMKPNTPAADAELEVERVPALLHCRDCPCDFAPESYPAPCPKCGSWASDVRQGHELDLMLVEFAAENLTTDHPDSTDGERITKHC
ncbi:MAG: hydrogenase maturation nickel metallochaperone HypA [Planctomycetes bacterium]|nr:hydrogenase maturation nickel metallochaperone HypA [Planctomycetota bacterium]